eukprot:TRINITY_DN825_c0_g1_i1.p1 TRINITY_DN825_c0_g1~~TRINITY_DN825_c0_g1_i1.p1  ORF type:complete len:500 (-),score=93.99 TRINITY_DN825_c0_g1_i1:88-1587(-)
MADIQLSSYAQARRTSDVLTQRTGAPTDSLTVSRTAGARGPVLVEDFTLIDHMASFDRERIPERVVHAKGAGAFGYFEVTHDITKYTRARVFEKVGKRTPVAVRFSTVGGESGSADTARDPRGFAVKFYTDEGNWDLVGNNTPIFFIRDPILFPSFIHTQKRNPQTHLKDPDMFWDFISLRPETTHQVSFLFSNRGTPNGFRFMHGFGSHTFRFVNAQGQGVWVKFHWVSDQGIKNLSADEAHKLSADNPDYSIQDLYNAIARNEHPSWTLKIQVMTEQEAVKFRWNPFDLTKIWPHAEFPLIPVGRMVLNRNPENYFAEVEQIAFAPSHMVPGIEPSPDKMLQGRLFSYPDTHRHRLGANYLQIPVNAPQSPVRSCTRDGPMNVNNQGGAPNYFPNSFNGPNPLPTAKTSFVKVEGECGRWDDRDDDNFSQVGIFWEKVLNEKEKIDLVNNIAGHLKNAKPFIQQRAVENFAKAHPDYGKRLKDALTKFAQPKPASRL